MPEAGCFGVAPGTNEQTNPNCMASLKQGVIFTNMTDDGDVWWEGMTDVPPAHLIDWQGRDWTPEAIAGPRDTQSPAGRAPERPLGVAATNNPVLDPGQSRRRTDRCLHLRRHRSTTVPLVTEARTGSSIYMAATMGSETTAQPAARKVVRRDPIRNTPPSRAIT